MGCSRVCRCEIAPSELNLMDSSTYLKMLQAPHSPARLSLSQRMECLDVSAELSTPQFEEHAKRYLRMFLPFSGFCILPDDRCGSESGRLHRLVKLTRAYGDLSGMLATVLMIARLVAASSSCPPPAKLLVTTLKLNPKSTSVASAPAI